MIDGAMLMHYSEALQQWGDRHKYGIMLLNHSEQELENKALDILCTL